MGVENIFSGPGIFTWGVDNAGANEADAVTFDLTQGGIRFFTETTYYEPTVDQYGTAPVKSVKTGTVGRVEFQNADIDFSKVVKFDNDVTETTDSLDATKKKYDVKGLAGQTLPKKRAVIKPQGVTDPNRFIYLESCSIKFDANFGYQNDNNLQMPINVVAYPDHENGGTLYVWGDITATA